MKISLRTKLIISFLIIITISGLTAGTISVRLIDKGIIQQERDKVKNDLNSARLIYQQETEKIADIIRFTSLRYFVADSILKNDMNMLKNELDEIRKTEHLDILSLTDKDGIVLIRSRNPSVYGDSQKNNVIVQQILEGKKKAAGTIIVSHEELEKEGKDLVKQAEINIIQTPRSSHQRSLSVDGMVISSGVPVYDNDGNRAFYC